MVHTRVQSGRSTAKVEDVQQSVRGLLSQQASCYGNFSLTTFDDPFLQKHVESVSVCDFELLDLPSGEVKVTRQNHNWYPVYRLTKKYIFNAERYFT